MQTHDSNVRPSVREHFTDNTPNHPPLIDRVDWSLVFRTCAKLFGAAAMVLLVLSLKEYASIAPDPLSLLPSIGQFLTACFFFYMMLITPKRLEGFNFLYLAGLVGVLVVF